MPSRKKQTLAIVGVGMMGGSLGLALKSARAPYRILGVGRSPERLKRALRLGAVDAVTADLEGGLGGADLVVLCTAVDEIAALAVRVAGRLKPGCVVTDIGSVKSAVLRGVEGAPGLGRSFDFVGGHPLAGSEKTGVENARPGLYRGATVVLCAGSARPAALARVAALWRAAGAKTLRLQPEVHDILVAQTSHLPHVLAAALARLVGGLNRKDKDAKRLLAGSFRDLTRIADSDPAQWAAICRLNQRFVVGAIRSYADILSGLAHAVESSPSSIFEWESFFQDARKSRRELLGS